MEIGISTRADVSGARQADAALEDVARTAREAAEAADAITAGAVDMSGGLDKTGAAAVDAARLVGNFAARVGAGQDAMRAFTMQAPGVISTLQSFGLAAGPAGIALAGLAAALPLAAAAFTALRGEAESAAESMEDAAKAARQAAEESIRAANEDAEARWQAARAVEQSWDAARAAQRQAAAVALEADAAALGAREEMNRALGKTVDLTREWEALEERRRARAMEEAMRPTADAAEAAAAETVAARQRADWLAARKQALVDDSVHAAKTVAEWKAAVRELQEERGRVTPAMMMAQGPYGGHAAAGEMTRQTREADAKIAELERRIAEMEASGEAFGEAALAMNGKIEAAENAYLRAAADARDKAEAARTAAQQAAEAMELGSALEEWREIQAAATRRAAEMDAILHEITPATDRQEQTVASLRKLTADGSLAAGEASALAAQAGELVGGLQFGLSRTAENQQRIIAAINRMVEQTKADADRIRALEAKINSPTFRR